MCYFILFSSCSHLPWCIVIPSSLHPKPFPRGAPCLYPQKTPSNLLRGIQKARNVFPFPLLNEPSFPALAWPRVCWTPPRFAFPLPVCGWVPSNAPEPSLPADPGLLPGSGRAGGAERTKPNPAIHQHHEAEENSLSEAEVVGNTDGKFSFSKQSTSQLCPIKGQGKGSSSRKHRVWSCLCSNCINSFMACFPTQKESIEVAEHTKLCSTYFYKIMNNFMSFLSTPAARKAN